MVMRQQVPPQQSVIFRRFAKKAADHFVRTASAYPSGTGSTNPTGIARTDWVRFDRADWDSSLYRQP